MSDFIHLHNHSHYSLLTALPKLPDLVAKAKSLGMSAIALTDNANLYGAIEFYQACKKKEIKPIIGIDAYIALRTRHDKQARIDHGWYRLVLLAENETGYKNLIKLVTEAHIEGMYYKPRIDHDSLSRMHKGLIAILPSFSGEVQLALQNGDEEKAKEILEKYKKLFDADHLYMEVSHHPEIEGHQVLTKKCIAFAKKYQIPLVAAHDTYYLEPGDKAARNTLLSIQQNGDRNERKFGTAGEFHMPSPEEMEQYFADLPEAIANSKIIADRCNLELKLAEWKFPNYIVESGLSYDEELRKLAYEGIAKRGLPQSKEVTDRLDYELQVIKDKGYAQYFLVVSDLLRYAHENGILTNIRGSVAGSLTTYVTRITNVDPLEYKLPFERFLNPQRPSAPDIDMDFADNRRDEVIEYTRKKYGHDKVAQIGTFGTMMARGAVRDVARAMGFPYETGDRISKLIPMGSQGFAMTIDRALEETPELKALYDKDDEAHEILEMAKKIEGCARHISVHAAGVVIAPTALTDYVPLQYDTKGDAKIITQYDMHGVGEDGVGLLKFDFLGIKNLAILANAVQLTKKIEGIDVDIEQIDLADKKTFAMLARGETIGLFQLNGGGMTKHLMELRPSTIHDINAMVALYRPGPMESIPEYIARKHNPHLVRYLDPRLKDILSQSYGVITYQDDVMLIAIHLAGYSWLEADKLRKAMGKKIPAEMEAQKAKLHDGFIKNGLSEETAQELWKLIEPFAAYGFNKAHAASYGRVAYQTSYMKANFPAVYMSAVLTADSGDIEKISEIVGECKRMGIDVLAPNINESFAGFTVIKQAKDPAHPEKNTDKIRFGLTTIKNFGEGIADAIIAERKNNGPFTSLSNFLERVTDKNLNKKSLKSLIKSGAMDEFGERGSMLFNLDRLLEFNKEHRGKGQGHDSLFGDMDLPQTNVTLESCPPAELKEKLLWEKELLGLYLSGHPLDMHKEALKKAPMTIGETRTNLREGMMATCYGLIEMIKPIRTKKNDLMYIIKIGDYTSSIEAVVFPKIVAQAPNVITPDACIAIQGRINVRNGEKGIVVDRMRSL